MTYTVNLTCVDRMRVFLDMNGNVRTVPEKLYLAVEQAAIEGTVASYLVHPDKYIRYLAALKHEQFRKVK